MMTARMHPFAAAPETMKALLSLETATRPDTVSLIIHELIKMRVSQINGCAYCLDMHAVEARAAGVSQQQLDVLAGWRESPAFDERERAALGWAEALTRIETTGAPDADYQALAAVFDERQRVELTVAINKINAWNRVAVGFRTSHPARDADRGN